MALVAGRIDSCELLNKIVSLFKIHKIDNPQLEAEHIMRAVMKVDRIGLYLDGYTMDVEHADRIDVMVKQRLAGRPLQYIIGSVEFMGLEFQVNEDVLIPRPETEILVEQACQFLTQGDLVLELGIGCGNIAVSLSLLSRLKKIIATDIKEETLKIARLNAKAHGVIDRIEFLKGDMFEPLDDRITDSYSNSFDMIVSNPPYVPAELYHELPIEVKYEPVCALLGGKDGLLYYREIARHSSEYLKRGGIVILELGDGQFAQVKDIMLGTGNFKDISCVKDYNRIQRVLIAINDRR